MEAVSKTKFGKGTRVEVSRRDPRYGTVSWLPGEITSGNGSTYSVQYGWPPPSKPKSVQSAVQRRFLRPAPPPVDGGMADWVIGDLVDVFINPCWKKGMIVKVQKESNLYSVKIAHSSTEFNVGKSHLRFRRSWEDGKWFVIGNQNQKFQMDMSNFEANARAARRMKLSGTSVPDLKKVTGQNSVNSSLLPGNCVGMQKRKYPMDSSDLEANVVAAKKIKFSGKDFGHQGSTPLRLPSSAPGKVVIEKSLKTSNLFASRKIDVVKGNGRLQIYNSCAKTHSSDAKDRSYRGQVFCALKAVEKPRTSIHRSDGYAKFFADVMGY